MNDFLKTLRRTNGERAVAWLDGHPSDPLFWAAELGGEVGEILNVVKKLVRQQLGWVGSRASVDDLADEIADGIICLDSLARHYGIDLQAVVTRKFNATSQKNGFPHQLGEPSPANQDTARSIDFDKATSAVTKLYKPGAWVTLLDVKIALAELLPEPEGKTK